MPWLNFLENSNFFFVQSGYAIDRTYTGDFTIPQSVIQNIEQKMRFHQYYVNQTIFELKRNAYTEKLINKEMWQLVIIVLFFS